MTLGLVGCRIVECVHVAEDIPCEKCEGQGPAGGRCAACVVRHGSVKTSAASGGKPKKKVKDALTQNNR